MRGLWLLLPLLGCTKADGDTEVVDTDVVDTDVATGTLDLAACDTVFPPVQPGETSYATFKLFNHGTATRTILSVSATSPFGPASSEAGVRIGGGAVYQFSASFQPTTWGDVTGTLEIVTDAKTWTCTLTGSAPSDVDGDGYVMVAAGGDDCDDTDATIHPNATDAPYDGVDADCDESNDFDGDHDGYESKVFNPSPEAGGGDCDDVDATVHPGAADPVGGLDLDCDGIG